MLDDGDELAHFGLAGHRDEAKIAAGGDIAPQGGALGNGYRGEIQRLIGDEKLIGVQVMLVVIDR